MQVTCVRRSLLVWPILLVHYLVKSPRDHETWVLMKIQSLSKQAISLGCNIGFSIQLFAWYKLMKCWVKFCPLCVGDFTTFLLHNFTAVWHYTEPLKVKSYLFGVFIGSECCSFQQSCQQKSSGMPCLMFFWQDASDSHLEKTSHILSDIICPVLLETIVKGMILFLHILVYDVIMISLFILTCIIFLG